MRLAFTSDFHGYLPNIEDCQILCICGDIEPVWNHSYEYHANWLNTVFREWCNKIKKRNIEIITISGNHSLMYERAKHLVPKLPVYYLENSSVEIKGLKFWGSPYSTQFGQWAFMDTDTRLQQYWDKIPDNVNILLTHGPAYGILDWSNYGKEHTGSKTLLNKINNLKELKIFHSGHIHEAYGTVNHNNITCINACYLNEYYKAVNSPVYLDFEV